MSESTESQKEQTEKLFYSIGEVSEMFDLNASTLRFWEKEFDFLRPGKNKKGNRLFTQKDIDNISRIVELVKNKGYTIQGAREQFKNSGVESVPVSNTAEVIARLEKVKSKLLDLRDKIDE
jgi:DNA-binding transcriptional MerR regulator